MQSINEEFSNNSMLVDHACILKLLKLETTSSQKLAVEHTSVRQLVFWLLVVASNYFIKFHDFSMIIKIFSNSMIFPCMELFFSDFPGFP